MFQFIRVPLAIKLEEVKLSQRFINVVHEFQQGSTKYLQTDSPFTLKEKEETETGIHKRAAGEETKGD